MLPVFSFAQELPNSLLPGLPFPPSERFSITGRTEGTGTYFEIEDSEYMDISLSSSQEIKVVAESVSRMISLNIESAFPETTISNLTIKGLEPNKIYYKYENSYKNLVVFVSNENGEYSWQQELSLSNHIWFQEEKSTIFIPEDCATYGVWDSVTSTCTLNQDLNQSVEITQNNIVLDCNSHKITGADTGYGIYLNSKTGITLQNIVITNFYHGISLFFSNDNVLKNIIAHSNYPIGISLESSSNNTLTSINADSNGIGFVLNSSSNNRLNESTANFSTGAAGGIEIYSSSNNRIINNTVNSNYFGIYIASGSNNTIQSNVANSNWYGGIFLYSSSSNQIINNTVLSVYGECGICLIESSNNLITDNSASNRYGNFNNFLGSYHNNIYHNNFMSEAWSSGYVYYGEDNTFDNDYPSGGNYWSDYSGIDLYSGPNQDQLGADGIGDSVYVSNPPDGGIESLIDRYPFMQQDGWKIQQNQPPVCNMKLQKNGSQIDKINVAEFFDIDVGESSDDNGIAEVRFSSDDLQNGSVESAWTSWYNWNESSSENWNSQAKTARWSFATYGLKEVWVEVKDTDGQTSGCFANISAVPMPLDVAVILAETNDVPYESSSITAQPCKLIPQKTYSQGRNKEYFEDLLYCVADYHKENSFGGVNLNFTIYDNGGEWFRTDKKEEDYYLMSKDEKGKGEQEFVKDAINLATNKNINLSNQDIITVVHSGSSYQKDYIPILRPHPKKLQSSTWSPNKILVAENDLVGIQAHEIGHVLGGLITPENTITPDLYKMGNVGKWDLMARGSWNNGVLFNRGANPPYMSSFTKEFLGWLNYDIHPKSTYREYWINSLETSKLSDSAFRYNLSDDSNGDSSRYYILEARNRNLKTWDSSLPGLPVADDKNLVLYYVDTKGLPEYGYVPEGTSGYQEGVMWSQYRIITIPGSDSVNDGILNPLINETYRDLDNLVKFSAIADRTIDNKYEIQARIEEITYDSFNDNFWGVILRPKSTFKKWIEGVFNSNFANNSELYKLEENSIKAQLAITSFNGQEKNGKIGMPVLWSKEEVIRVIKIISFEILISIILLNFLLILLNKKVFSRWKLEKTQKIIKIAIKVLWIISIIVIVVSICLLVIAYTAPEPREPGKLLKTTPNNNSNTILSPALETIVAPDLDLHLYCDDGKHIGINYETGEYEVQISEAIVSGDNQNSPEWIFIPESITDCHYVVSSYDNQKFLEENPEIAQEIEDSTDSYEIYARYIDHEADIYTSQILTEQSINPGENVIHQTTGTADIAISQGIVDSQGPIITHIELKPEYLLNSPAVTFNFSAQDEGVGVKEITVALDGNPLANGQNIAFDRVGAHAIAITASDFFGNTADKKIDFSVIYSFGGFLPPVVAGGSGIYKFERTLPVKFQLTDANNNFISNAIASIVLAKVSNNIYGDEEVPLSTFLADIGNQFRYSTIDKQYIFNLSTKNLTVGSWSLMVKLNDDRYHNVLIAIK